MTRTELYDRITQCLPSGYRYEIGQAVEKIWGQPFDGETERIKPATEESSATDNSGNEANFITKPMTADEIMAGKMAKDQVESDRWYAMFSEPFPTEEDAQ